MAAGAELLTRLFLSEIQPKLFPGNTFLARAKNDDAYVNYNTVELAHSGTIPNATVDRVMLPATVSKRTDAATDYSLEELTTDPTLLGYSEELIINYNKRQDILEQHANSINTLAADRALYKWAAGAGTFGSTNIHVIKSTGVTDGGAAVTRTAAGPAQTGTRNAFGKADLLKVRQAFFKDDVINTNTDPMLVGVLTPDQYSDLTGLPNVAEAQKYGRAIFPTGVVDRILGIDIYVRSRVIVMDNSDALKTQGAAGATTDQDAALFWHPNFVRRAVGAINPFVRLKDPLYYGDVFDMLVRFGAAPVRNDNKGVVILMEDNN